MDNTGGCDTTGGMRIQCPHCAKEHEVAEGAILSESARIQNQRRKTHGAPLKVFRCRWCNRTCAGKAGLREHMRNCDQSLGAMMGLQAFSG